MGYLLADYRAPLLTTGSLTWSPKSSLSMLIYVGIKGMYNANMVPNLAYVPTKFG